MKTYIDYYSAVHWTNSSLILFNDIHEIDPDFHNETEPDEEGNYPEIHQYFLTALNDKNVEWMRKTFPDVILAYSDKLGLWVLCVDHFGTSWDYVWTEVSENLTKYYGDDFFNEKGEGTITLQRDIKAKFMRTKEKNHD